MFIRIARNRTAFALALWVAFVFRADASPKTSAVSTTVCEVTQHPERFVGRRVSFDAVVVSDGIERTVLFDNRNQECTRGIVPTTDVRSQQGRVADRALERALSQGHPGTLDKKITAHFLGVLSMGDPEQFMMAPGAKVIVLTLESVQDLKIEKTH
jgi:hypothetical protein